MEAKKVSISFDSAKAGQWVADLISQTDDLTALRIFNSEHHRDIEVSGVKLTTVAFDVEETIVTFGDEYPESTWAPTSAAHELTYAQLRTYREEQDPSQSQPSRRRIVFAGFSPNVEDACAGNATESPIPAYRIERIEVSACATGERVGRFFLRPAVD